MRLRPAALLAALAAAVAAPGGADAARYAVGLEPGASAARTLAAVERLTGARAESLAPLPALVVEAADGRALRMLPGARYVERLQPRRQAFTPSDPLFPRQWHLARVRAFDSWLERPPLAGVRVAVIDSGVDRGHPDLRGRIRAARSFVGGSPDDVQGHGTIVAGVIAAEADNGIGVAGLAPWAELLVAKVVARDGSISVEAEARAIRWAVAMKARVINMSLGGVRDPSRPERDTYSQLEADAVAYAVSKGVLVVAAVGNGDQAPTEPWRFASYPAALPHVVGVSAVTRAGATPRFSNRDPVYNDVAAPGAGIVSTFPRKLTARRAGCADQGYTPCATEPYRGTEGTSFAAPQVSAAAATLLAVRPTLRASQVAFLLERTAVDARPATGCPLCIPGRDAQSGWGTLDVTAAATALDGLTPPPDAFEPNDDADPRAYRLYGRWSERVVRATLDFWDDQDDVYAVYLRAGQRIDVALDGPADTSPSLVLWRPGVGRIDDLAEVDRRLRFSSRPGSAQYVGARVGAAGWYGVQVRLSEPGDGEYRLTVVRSR
ncbi:MAG: S8 family serine peptidase [Thermoleophilia bacterium]|nr:S8 family serine peptidase [Thermoleophilia bacterium]MDH4346354.1 S8 family serine peptidase [Thermoleophilia bacterium]